MEQETVTTANGAEARDSNGAEAPEALEVTTLVDERPLFCSPESALEDLMPGLLAVQR